jgi:O-antigen chain-terminating methyltransferase
MSEGRIDTAPRVQRLFAERIRHQVDEARLERIDAAPTSRRSGSTSLASDVRALHSTWELLDIEYVTHRRLLGPLVVRVHGLLRRALKPLLLRQEAHNAASTRAIAALDTRVAELELALDEAVAVLETLLASPRSYEGASGLAARELNLRVHEDEFRGDETEITRRQQDYVGLFDRRRAVVDLGCGRGEFLALLRDAGVGARGVDTDPAMVERCREKGLDVSVDDAESFLASLRDATLDGIFVAQVIEHFEPQSVIHLVELSAAKLESGGILVFESPNPRSLLALSSFWLDFTHVRLYDPYSVAWLLRSRGFAVNDVRFYLPGEEELRLPEIPADLTSGSQAEEFNQRIGLLNDFVYGPRDYAVVAVRES